MDTTISNEILEALDISLHRANEMTRIASGLIVDMAHMRLVDWMFLVRKKIDPQTAGEEYLTGIITITTMNMAQDILKSIENTNVN